MVTRATLQREYDQPVLFDGGCGCGALLNAFDRTHAYARTLGMDASKEMIRLGRDKFGFPSDKLLSGSIDCVPFTNGSLTLINTSQVLEHIADESVDMVFSEFYRLLKAGGRMFHHYDALKHGDAADAYSFDPTHVNIKPQAYWTAHFVKSGFLPDFESYDRFVRSNETLTGDITSKTFFNEYRNWSVSTWIKP